MGKGELDAEQQRPSDCPPNPSFWGGGFSTIRDSLNSSLRPLLLDATSAPLHGPFPCATLNLHLRGAPGTTSHQEWRAGKTHGTRPHQRGHTPIYFSSGRNLSPHHAWSGAGGPGWPQKSCASGPHARRPQYPENVLQRLPPGIHCGQGRPA